MARSANIPHILRRDLVRARIESAASSPPSVDYNRQDAIDEILSKRNTDIARLAVTYPIVRTRLEEALHSFGPLLTGAGVNGVFVGLHTVPLREIHTPEQVSYMSLFRRPDGSTSFLSIIEWAVNRRPDHTIQTVRDAEVDQIDLPQHSDRFSTILADLALKSNFVPYKGLRVLLVVTDNIDPCGQVERLLVPVAAVAGGEVALAPRGDPNDSRYLARLARLVSDKRPQLLVTLSHPRERWVTRFGEKFSSSGATWRRLKYQDLAAVPEQLIFAIEALARDGPDFPLMGWGRDALSRVTSYEGAGFQLTEQAKRHLRSNPYPDVERMLEHLELVAQLAQQWHDREVTNRERFDDWATPRTALRIATSDRNIPLKSAMFWFERAKLDNRPHIKVDDGVAPARCGRIYFAIEDRRLVVDIIGIHDRY